MGACLAPVQERCQYLYLANLAVGEKSRCFAGAECRKRSQLRWERSLHGRQNWVESKGLVFKHVFTDRFDGPVVSP
jgi:hypothetical protein